MQRGRWTSTPVYTGNAIARSRTHCLVVLFIIMHITTAIARGLLCVYCVRFEEIEFFSLFLPHTNTHWRSLSHISTSLDQCVHCAFTIMWQTPESAANGFALIFNEFMKRFFPDDIRKEDATCAIAHEWTNAWERRNGKGIKSKSEIYSNRVALFFLSKEMHRGSLIEIENWSQHNGWRCRCNMQIILTRNAMRVIDSNESRTWNRHPMHEYCDCDATHLYRFQIRCETLWRWLIIQLAGMRYIPVVDLCKDKYVNLFTRFGPKEFTKRRKIKLLIISHS